MYRDFQAQGRYLFPALTPIAVYVLLGIRGLFPSPPLRQVGSVVVVVALFGLNIISLVGCLLPAYRVIATQ